MCVCARVEGLPLQICVSVGRGGGGGGGGTAPAVSSRPPPQPARALCRQNQEVWTNAGPPWEPDNPSETAGRPGEGGDIVHFKIAILKCLNCWMLKMLKMLERKA